jgi:hypothetical protein
MPSTLRSGVRRASVLVALCALTAGACASKQDAPSKAGPGESPAPASVTSPTHTQTTPDPGSTPSPGAGPSSPVTLVDRLLPTEDVPGLTGTWHWQDGETGAAGGDAFGLCAKVDLLSIGATDVVQRTYFPPVDTDDNAAEQIAEFPDATTTATAMKVLQSWRQRCAAKNLRVSPFTTVDGGSWYLVARTSANEDDDLFQAVGIATSGTRIAVMTIDKLAQDYDYPAGREPMVGMVRAAAARLG